MNKFIKSEFRVLSLINSISKKVFIPLEDFSNAAVLLLTVWFKLKSKFEEPGRDFWTQKPWKCGMILLVAMIGAIVLTMHKKMGVKRQEVYIQNNREFNKTIHKVS